MDDSRQVAWHTEEFHVRNVNYYSSCKGKLVERPVGVDIFYAATCTQFWSRRISVEKKTWSFWFLYHFWSWRCWRITSVSDTSGFSTGEFTAFWMFSGSLFAIGDNFGCTAKKLVVRQNIMDCRECCKEQFSKCDTGLWASIYSHLYYLAQFIWVFFLFLKWPFLLSSCVSYKWSIHKKCCY